MSSTLSQSANAFDFSARIHDNLNRYSTDSRNNFQVTSDKKHDKKPGDTQPPNLSLVNNAILYRA